MAKTKILRLSNDDKHFYQWDTERKLIVNDNTCDKVYFSNDDMEMALTCNIYEVDGVRMVNVPNIILQDAKPLKVHLSMVDNDGRLTTYYEAFHVAPRKKPNGYVYTETEVLNYAYLDERLKELEGEGLANAVADYLEKNPPQAGATEEEKNQIQQNKQDIETLSREKLNASKLPEAVNAALTQAKASGEFKGEAGKTPEKGKDYFTDADKREIAEQAATFVEIPEEDVDLTGYATEEWVSDGYQPKGEYLTEVPDGYAKTEDIPTKPEDIGAQPVGNYLTEVPSGFATEEFVKNKIAEAELGGEEVDLSGYAQKSELPTKVSQLQNDSGYLTSVPDGYAKTEDIPKNATDFGAQPEGDYALRSEIPSIPVESVNNKTGAVSLTASDVGALPNTAKIPGKTSDLTNDSGFITGYTETDPTVPAWAKNATKPSYTKSEIGLGNVDNVKQYSASNPPPYPVTSVNGKTGAVTLDASAVGARPDTWTPTYSDVGADKNGTAASAVSTHNTKTDAHNDIRLLITALTTRLDALANSDDDT